MLYDGALHDLPLFMHNTGRAVNVILHEPEACVTQGQSCMMERRMTCHCSCTVATGA